MRRWFPLVIAAAAACFACSSDKTEETPDTGADTGPPPCLAAAIASPPTCVVNDIPANPCTFTGKKIQWMCDIKKCPAVDCVWQNWNDGKATYSFWCCDK